MEVYFILILLGLSVGSFISAVTYRIPKGLGFVKGRSFCDNCKKELRWYDNIPLFSFLFYGGKSRCCNQKISIRYPLIELASVIGIVFLYPNYIFIILFLLTLSIFIIDLEHQIIPDELTWLLLLYAICFMQYAGFMPYGLGLTPYSHLFSGFLFALVLLIIHLVTGGRGMGLGDIKLAIPLGLWLGLTNGITWIMLSFLTGGLVASILLISGRAKMKTKIAFGPFLIFAFWLTLLIYA